MCVIVKLLINQACLKLKDFYFQDAMVINYFPQCNQSAYIHCVRRSERSDDPLWTFSFITVHLLALLFALDNQWVIAFSQNCIAGYIAMDCYEDIDIGIVIPSMLLV